MFKLMIWKSCDPIIYLKAEKRSPHSSGACGCVYERSWLHTDMFSCACLWLRIVFVQFICFPWCFDLDIS